MENCLVFNRCLVWIRLGGCWLILPVSIILPSYMQIDTDRYIYIYIWCSLAMKYGFSPWTNQDLMVHVIGFVAVAQLVLGLKQNLEMIFIFWSACVACLKWSLDFSFSPPKRLYHLKERGLTLMSGYPPMPPCSPTNTASFASLRDY